MLMSMQIVGKIHVCHQYVHVSHIEPTVLFQYKDALLPVKEIPLWI